MVNASCDDISKPACGIALNNAYAGELCKFTTSGTHTTTNTLVYGAIYFVGINGSMTSKSPSMPSYSQSIGIATSNNTLRVDFEEAVE